MLRRLFCSVALALCAHLGLAQADTLPDDIARLQQNWAAAYYQLPQAKKEPAFERLIENARSLTARYPGQAEPMVWEAIVICSAAKFEGGLGALGKIRRARDLLLAAEKIDAKALDGSIYTVLGSLYAKAPGWPLSFGDKALGERYLKKALAVSPAGADSNFCYADFLIDRKQYAEARFYLDKALAAPTRPGREVADAGRRAEIKAALARVQKALDKTR